MSSDYPVINLEDIEQEPFPESGMLHRKLTEPLGCTEIRVIPVSLDPGEATAPHGHERQDELYIALDGGCVQLDGTRHDISPGGIVRIGPEVIRSVRNDTAEQTHTWIMCGAPPLGTVEDFGEYRMPDAEEYSTAANYPLQNTAPKPSLPLSIV